jgi:hypothetical protein
MFTRPCDSKMISDQVGPSCYSTVTQGCSRLFRLLFFKIDSLVCASPSILLIATNISSGGGWDVKHEFWLENLVGVYRLRTGGEKTDLGEINS